MTEERSRLDINQICIVLLYLTALANFFADGSLSMITGPIMFILIVLLWSKGYTLYLIPLVMVGNDALGTVFMGRLSFDLVLAGLIVVIFLLRCGTQRKVDARIFIIVLFYIFYVIYMSFAGIIASDQMMATIFNLIFILYVYGETFADEEKLSVFFTLIGISVVLVALAMDIVGGHQTLEIVHDGTTRIKTMREGLLGTGSGDPNFSGLRLLLGFICIYTSKHFKLIWKLPMMFILGWAMIKTLSLTLMLVSCLLVVSSVLINKSLGKKIKAILIIAVVIFCGLYILQNIPESELPSQFRMLGLRINEKYLAFLNGGVNEVTSNRLKGTLGGLAYFSAKNILQQLFGFSPYFAHNSYVDLLNQFGIFGAVVLLVCVAQRFITHIKWNKESENYRCIALIKILYILFAYTLSIYSGVEFCLATLFLFVF